MTADSETTPAPNMDQVIATLRDAGVTPTLRRLVAVSNSQGELFDAASVILDWMQTLPAEDRPIAIFDRLLSAINGVREAHQMEPAP